MEFGLDVTSLLGEALGISPTLFGKDPREIPRLSLQGPFPSFSSSFCSSSSSVSQGWRIGTNSGGVAATERQRASLARSCFPHLCNINPIKIGTVHFPKCNWVLGASGFYQSRNMLCQPADQSASQFHSQWKTPSPIRRKEMHIQPFPFVLQMGWQQCLEYHSAMLLGWKFWTLEILVTRLTYYAASLENLHVIKKDDKPKLCLYLSSPPPTHSLSQMAFLNLIEQEAIEMDI